MTETTKSKRIAFLKGLARINYAKGNHGHLQIPWSDRAPRTAGQNKCYCYDCEQEWYQDPALNVTCDVCGAGLGKRCKLNTTKLDISGDAPRFDRLVHRDRDLKAIALKNVDICSKRPEKRWIQSHPRPHRFVHWSPPGLMGAWWMEAYIQTPCPACEEPFIETHAFQWNVDSYFCANCNMGWDNWWSMATWIKREIEKLEWELAAPPPVTKPHIKTADFKDMQQLGMFQWQQEK